MNKTDIHKINSIISNEILVNESMKLHTTFGIGGNVSCYVYPENKNELSILLAYCSKKRIPLFFAGSGSNLLVNDDGFNGVVISLQKYFKKITIKKNGILKAEAGVMLGNMVKNAIKSGIKGLESLAGVPGTVGGALIMNAGAFGSEISNFFNEATVLTSNGEEKIYTSNHIKFGYRSSTFPKNEILIDTSFKCETGEPIDIINNKNLASQKRKDKQPLKFRSAGSIFKNPSIDFSAGYLIEKAGLKGMKSGSAEISKKHANFIVNHGGAKASDVISLIKLIKSKVAKNFNVNLELEIKLLGFSKDIMDTI